MEIEEFSESVKKHHTTCLCLSTKHLVQFSHIKWDEGDEELDVSMQMNYYHGFFGRLRIAFMYLFKMKGLASEYPWDHTMIGPTQGKKIRDFLTKALD